MGGDINVEPMGKLRWRLGGNVTLIRRDFGRVMNVEPTWKFGGKIKSSVGTALKLTIPRPLYIYIKYLAANVPPYTIPVKIPPGNAAGNSEFFPNNLKIVSL